MADKKLPDLPETSDKEFWGGYTEIIEMHEKERCLHGGNLTSRGNNEAWCINCNAVWQLGIGDRILDGHLYHNDLKIIQKKPVYAAR